MDLEIKIGVKGQIVETLTGFTFRIDVSVTCDDKTSYRPYFPGIGKWPEFADSDSAIKAMRKEVIKARTVMAGYIPLLPEEETKKAS